jgi:hypothetical protein
MKRIKLYFWFFLCMFMASAMNAQNHWTPDIGNFSDNMSVTSAVYLNGTQQLTNTQIEVAAFCNGVCRGTAFVGNGGVSGVCFLSVFGKAGDTFTFQIYDHNTSQEYPATNAALAYVSDGVYGSPSSPYRINIGTVATFYSVTVAPTTNGTVTANPNSAAADTQITLTVTPSAGYELATITATGANITGSNAQYQFTMPAANVTVTATFRQIETQPNTDAAAIAAAKALIEGSNYTIAQASANTETGVRAWLIAQINALPGMSTTGVTIGANDIALIEFTAAQGGTSVTPAGTNGNFSFVVLLTKGANSATVNNAGVITATPYGNLNFTVTFTAMEHGSVTTTATNFAANATVLLIVNPNTGYELQTITATGVTVTGSGALYQFTMPANNVTVSATFKQTQNPPDLEAAVVALAKALIESNNYTIAQATANTEESIKARLEAQINALSGINAAGITISASNIVFVGFNAAQGGTFGNPAGTNGNFNFVVLLNKGATSVMAVASGTILATPYLTTGINVPQTESLKAVIIADALQVSGLVPGEIFSVYNLQGKAVYHQGKARGTNQTVSLNRRGIYIVVAGERRLKVLY